MNKHAAAVFKGGIVVDKDSSTFQSVSKTSTNKAHAKKKRWWKGAWDSTHWTGKLAVEKCRWCSVSRYLKRGQDGGVSVCFLAHQRAHTRTRHHFGRDFRSSVVRLQAYAMCKQGCLCLEVRDCPHLGGRNVTECKLCYVGLVFAHPLSSILYSPLLSFAPSTLVLTPHGRVPP